MTKGLTSPFVAGWIARVAVFVILGVVLDVPLVPALIGAGVLVGFHLLRGALRRSGAAERRGPGASPSMAPPMAAPARPSSPMSPWKASRVLGKATAAVTKAERLRELGCLEDALVAEREAGGLYRLLAELSTGAPGWSSASQPGSAGRNLLGGSLCTQAEFLSDLGRYEEALAASAEAVAIFRRSADALPTTVVSALLIHSRVLSDLGRSEEALAVGREALAAGDRLEEANTGSARWWFMHARSLELVARALQDLGHDEDAHLLDAEALAARHKAVALRDRPTE
jgi:tetratricopeptide (TPR) repeat protein